MPVRVRPRAPLLIINYLPFTNGPSPRGRREGGRNARRAKRLARVHHILATLENKLPPLKLLSPEQVERIHEASMAILEEVGIDFRDPIAHQQWREAGADVDGQRVRPDRALIMDLEPLRGAFFAPELFDNDSIEQWQAEGSKEITQRALEHARKLLADYEYPPLDPATDEALLDFIRRREAEIPASDELNQSC